MSKKDKEKILTSNESIECRHSVEEIIAVINEFFNHLNFSRIHVTSTSLSINNGSKLSNPFTHNPLKWNSNIEIELKRENDLTTINIDIEVNTSGQIPIQHELDTWNLLREKLNDSIINLKPEYIEVKESSIKANKKSNVMMIILFAGLISSLLLGATTGIYFDIKWLFIVITIAGIVLTFKAMDKYSMK